MAQTMRAKSSQSYQTARALSSAVWPRCQMHPRALCSSQRCTDKAASIPNLGKSPLSRRSRVWLSDSTEMMARGPEQFSPGCLLIFPGQLVVKYARAYSNLTVRQAMMQKHTLVSTFSSTHNLVFKSRAPLLTSLTTSRRWSSCAVLFQQEHWKLSIAGLGAFFRSS